jgi:hypothetical protein
LLFAAVEVSLSATNDGCRCIWDGVVVMFGLLGLRRHLDGVELGVRILGVFFRFVRLL